MDDKIRNEAQEWKGKAKEAVGDATDDESMQAKGKAEQAMANAKQMGEKAKDKAKDAIDKM